MNKALSRGCNLPQITAFINHREKIVYRKCNQNLQKRRKQPAMGTLFSLNC
uniref:Uncharacterized protein n=1 Tax=Anguilla anguilla TaxID=7936 RepID=A0A0E9VZF5_ANGAN